MASTPSENWVSLSSLKETHTKQLEGLVLSKRPFSVLKYFTLAVLQYLWQVGIYIFSHKLSLALIPISCFLWVSTFFIEVPQMQFLHNLFPYLRYGFWWVALGIASSVGLGTGLHTFVLYLGPHIAMFTIKATECGRIDLKRAMYDTIVFGVVPSWPSKECSIYGPPEFPHIPGSERFQVPLLAILHEVHWEAILWGIGTALGELPPYFLSRAERLSGERLRQLDDLTVASSLEVSVGGSQSILRRLKMSIISYFRHFSFWTILMFASVPNPFFDLAGMMCGQVQVPFWKFFIPTLIGKAFIKTHLQTLFIILVCNNQLMQVLDTISNWALEHTPAISHVHTYASSKLLQAREKYNNQPVNDTPVPWKFSLSFVWNTFVWIMLLGFFSSILERTAQSYLMELQRQERELLQIPNKDEGPKTL